MEAIGAAGVPLDAQALGARAEGIAGSVADLAHIPPLVPRAHAAGLKMAWLHEKDPPEIGPVADIGFLIVVPFVVERRDADAEASPAETWGGREVVIGPGCSQRIRLHTS